MALYRVTSPHYCAGFYTDGRGLVVGAAPILHRTIGKRVEWLVVYFHNRKASMEKVCPTG